MATEEKQAATALELGAESRDSAASNVLNANTAIDAEDANFDRFRILHTKIELAQLRHIDTANRSFEVDVEVTMRWKMSDEEEKTVLELQSDPEKLNEYLSHIDCPALMHDARDTEVEFRCHPNKLVISLVNTEHNELQFVSIQDITGTFPMDSDRKEMLDFPFDLVKLPIWLCAKDCSRDRFKIVLDSNQNPFTQRQVLLRPFNIQSEEFQVYMADVYTFVSWDGPREGYFPQIMISLSAQRRHVYYLKHTAVLVFLLSIMVFPAYAIDVTSLGDRLSHLVTLLLAQAVFMEYLGGSLPRLAYFTVLDEYILWNFVLTLAVAMQMAIVYRLMDPDDIDSVDRATRVDNYCFLAFVAAFVVINLFYVAISYRRWKRNTQAKFKLDHVSKKEGFIRKEYLDGETHKFDPSWGSVCVYHHHNWDSKRMKYRTWGKQQNTEVHDVDYWEHQDRVVILVQDYGIPEFLAQNGYHDD